MEKEDPKVGDVMVNGSPCALSLARRIRVTEVTKFYLRADVLEGENTTDPLTVYRDGWDLYTKDK